MLIPSLILYGIVQVWGLDLPSYPQGHTWYFNPFAWQLIFFIGVICGHPSSKDRMAILHSPWLLRLAFVIAGVCMVTSLTSLLHGLWPAFPAILATPPIADKTTMAPIRIIDFLAIAPDRRPRHSDARVLPDRAHRLADRAVRQFSLYVFCLTILLALLGRFVLQEVNASFGMQLLVNIVGIATMIALSTFLAWYRNDGHVPEPPRLSSPEGRPEPSAMNARTPVHGGGLHRAEQRWGRPAAGWLDLSTGINPLALCRTAALDRDMAPSAR